jgi:hypothetical protein
MFAGQVCHVLSAHSDIGMEVPVRREHVQSCLDGCGIVQDILRHTVLKGGDRYVHSGKIPSIGAHEAIDHAVNGAGIHQAAHKVPGDLEEGDSIWLLI